MINAQEAKQNRANYEIGIHIAVSENVNELINTMSASIEFHSKNGFDSLEFCPYDKSRFPSHQALKIAETIFAEILTSNGYEIIHNDAFNNSLKIRW